MVRILMALVAAVALGVACVGFLLADPDAVAPCRRGSAPAGGVSKAPAATLAPGAAKVAPPAPVAEPLATTDESPVEEAAPASVEEASEPHGADRGDLEVVLVDERGRSVLVERGEVELAPGVEEARTRVLAIGTGRLAPDERCEARDLAVGTWTATLRVEEPADVGAAPRVVRIERGANRIALVVRRLGLLRGIVRSACGADTPFEVTVEPASGEAVHLACDGAGRFEWRGLGAARVRAEADGHGAECVPLELGSGSVLEVALDLRPGTWLDVRAVAPDGAPAAFEEVTACPETDPERTIRAALDEGGRASLCVGGRGPFQVSVAGVTRSVSGGEVVVRLGAR